MITKIGNELLTKEAGIPQLIGKAWRFGTDALKGAGSLIEHGASGAVSGAAGATAEGAGRLGTAMAKTKGFLGGMRQGMNDVWNGTNGVKKLTGSQKAGVGMLTAGGMGMLAGGDASAPAPQYNFYQSGYPQQFSGSWQ